MQNLSPFGWALRPLKRYAEFSGRASRAEFWWFTLFLIVTYIVVIMALGTTAGGLAAMNPASAVAAGGVGLLAIFIGLFWLAMFIPVLAVQIRRLHDINRSGWWMGAFWLLYLAYVGFTFSYAFAASSVTDGAPPSVAGALAVAVLAVVFFVYSIVLLVFFCLPGTKGANRYGDDPYGADVAEVFA